MIFAILSLLSGGLVSILLVFVLLIGQFPFFLRVEKKSYQYALSEWTPKHLPLASHFPTKIPPKAQKIKIRYLPRFIQAPGVFYLSMILPEKEFIIAKESISKKEDFRVLNDCNNEFSSFHYRGMKNEEEFEVFYLNLQNKQYSFPQGDLNYCNHGYTRGVAFKKDSNLIIYFTSIW